VTRTFERLGLSQLGTIALGGQRNPAALATPASGMVMPTVQIQVSFTDPWTTPDWVDITQYVQTANTKRGRQHELQRATAGTAQLSVYNQDGRFSTFNATGPYVNLLSGPTSFFQDNSLDAWTAAANVATPTLNLTAGYDAQPALVMSSTAAGSMSVKTGTGTAGAAVTVGKTYTAMAGFSAASLGRATRVDISWYNGAALLSTSTGTASTDSAGIWTKATCIAAAPANATNATIVCNVLSAAGAAEVHYVDRVALFTGDAHGTASTGWAPGGRGGLVPTRSVRILATWAGITYPIYSGFVDSWIPSFVATKSLQTINCVDAFSLMALGYLLNPNYYPSIVKADVPTAYYRLGESGGMLLADSSGNGNTAITTGTPAYSATGALLYDTDAGLDLSNGTASPSGGIRPAPAYTAAATGVTSWTFEAWVKTTSSATQQVIQWISNTAAGTMYTIGLMVAGGLVSIRTGPQSSATIGLSTTAVQGTTVVNDGAWHHIAVTLTQDQVAQVGTWTLYQDGVLVGQASTFAWNGSLNVGYLYWYFSAGASTGYAMTWTGSIDELAIYPSALSAARIAAHSTAGWLLRKVESSGARIQGVLNIMGVPTAYQNVASGVSQVQNESTALTTTQALSYIQTIEKTEQGFTYIDEAGVFTFRARNYTWNGTTLGTVANNTSAANMHPVEGAVVPEAGSVDLWNTVPVSARANAALGVSGSPQTAQNVDSAQWYGKRALTGYTGFLMTSDGAALALGQYLVNRYSTPQARVKTVAVDSLVSKGAQLPQMLGRYLLDRITVIMQPLDGTTTPFTQDSYIESVSHSITPGHWTTTWALTPAEAQIYFKLDDHTNGVLVATGATNSGELSY